MDIAQSIFIPGANHANGSIHPPFIARTCKIQSRRLVYGHIVDPDTGQVLDEVLLVVMPGPHSYTAEDVVEIQAHAGPLILKTILSLILKKGAVLAAPGEFTKRAFLNGRIDLTRAEAVIDMINARSSQAVAMAMAQLSGGLRDIISSLRSAIVAILASIEAAIDFADEVGEDVDIEKISVSLEQDLLPRIYQLISRHDEENFLRQGLKVVIAGAPNVGKSSLLNRLLNRERAIVTEFPGTTRDFIEDSFVTGGVPIIVTDTAGIQETTDPVERIGIEKAWEHARQADIVLFVIDAGKPVSADNIRLFQKLAGKKIILVINKTDLPPEDQFFSLPSQWRDMPRLEISALYNRGLDELKDMIATMAFASVSRQDHPVVPNIRHKAALESAGKALDDALNGLRDGVSLDLIAIDLHAALDALSEITGEQVGQEVIDMIFSRFCIGK